MRILRSTISTAGDVRFQTSGAGRTVVQDSAVSGASVLVTAGSGGVCTAGNTPALACS